MTDAPERIWAWRHADGLSLLSDQPLLADAAATEYIRSDLPRPQDAARIAELEAENARLREALTLAANRLHRCAEDYDTGSHEFFETGEWAREARATLAADSGAADA